MHAPHWTFWPLLAGFVAFLVLVIRYWVNSTWKAHQEGRCGCVRKVDHLTCGE